MQTKSSWLQIKLGTLGEFKNGVNFKKGDKGEGIRLINVKDLFNDTPYINFDDLDRVNLSKQKGIEKFYVEVGDIFFSRSSVKRDGVGVVSIAPKSDKRVIHCGFVIRFRITSKEVNPLFLTYLLRSDYYRQVIIGISGGSAIINISQDSLASLQLNLPPLPTQQKIASILTAYDDLIENNTRRIKILEEMARSHYHEWFVNFRFPGYEQVKMIDSELGLIPEGWEVKKITDAVFVKPKTQVPKEGEKPFVTMSCLSNDSMLINNIESRSGNNGSKFKNGDTLFARITPCLENGKTGYVQFLPSDDAVAFGSTEFIVLRSKTLCCEYVYLMARSDAFRDIAIKSMTGATGRQRVQEACFDAFLFAHPDIETITKFSKIISLVFKQIYVLSQKNINLRKTRDLLLPKLISGEIDVEKLEIETEKIAA